MSVFGRSNILLPDVAEMNKWAVIACDQYTSDPQYWDRVESYVGSADSAFRLIYPEVWLNAEEMPERISRIREHMQAYLQSGIFRECRDSYIYVERTLPSGVVRRGILGVVDLEEYSFKKDSGSLIRATEATVVERIPPRVKIRETASLELPHVILFCNDQSRSVIEKCTEQKDSLRKLYAFQLMEGGGQISGRQICGEYADMLDLRLEEYYRQQMDFASSVGNKPLYFCIGDGNHSLAAAKACYEQLKTENEQAARNHPARYALVELENLYDDSIVFDGIHRLVHMNEADIPELLKALSAGDASECNTRVPIRWYHNGESGTVELQCPRGKLPVACVQEILDHFLQQHCASIDYIHGVDSLKTLSQKEEFIGLELPTINKLELFPGIAEGGVLPRKAFSVGQADDKRYYVEARKIVSD